MLKALELTGFKSFAERTRFEFHEGVTVVVGPNGSGKSNVVDAIKWVLGSQSAKSLRGDEMTDVIFNGSGSRAAVHSAEVRLVLDNSDGRYGTEARSGAAPGEVTIARRVYRSGEGEYLINGAACRLRDVRDLLAGTGIGTEAYSIIEQGKVDALLQASPRDRRAIFEEAAGISRFRLKRGEAARRLARVEQNLLRLSDIVDEVESRLRSVRMQAGKAQRYREGTRRLRELRTQLGIIDWSRLSAQLSGLAEELTRFDSDRQQRKADIATGQERLAELVAALQRVQADAEQLESELGGLREQQVRLQTAVAGLADRRGDVEAQIARLEQQWRAAHQPPEQEGPDAADLQTKLAVAREEYDHAARELADAVERERRLATAVERGGVQLAELRRRQVDVERQAVRAEQQQALLAGEHEARSQELDRVRREASELTTELAQLTTERTAAHQAQRQLTEQAQAREQQLAAAQSELAEHQRRLAERQRECQRVEAELSSRQHRAELMDELDREHQQAHHRTRQFLAETLQVRPAVVADLLHVDVDTAQLIEAALGAMAEFYVVSSTADLLRHAQHLPAGARLLRLDYRPPASAIDRIDLAGQPGVWGRADEFVDSEPAYAPLVRRLLGRTWVVDTLATAGRLAAGAGQGLHFVTADGDLLTADGALVVGRRNEARTALTRRNQIEQLQVEIDQLAPRAKELRDEWQRLEAEQADVQATVAEALDRHRLAVESLATVRQQVVALDERHRLYSDRQRAMAREEQSLAEQVAAAAGDLQQLQTKQNLFGEQTAQLRAACEAIQTQVEAVEQQWREAREAAHRYEVIVARLEQQIDVTAATLATHPGSVRQSNLRDELADELAACRARLAAIDRELLDCSAQLAELQARREQLAPRRRAAVARRQSLQTRRDELQQRVDEATRRIDDTQARRAKLEVDAARVEHQRQTLAERLRDDYEIDLPKVAAQAPPMPLTIDREQAEREIKELRESLHRIGSVNVDALEELDEMESRYEAISAQYNDLSQAKAHLERLMVRLNTESRQLFLSTVETVRGHFKELFRRLFGGGEADLLLEEYDSDDALECGVEIRACPPGKEMRTISLLSGGEKTMTCVALLLALFRSKPSPFCVLDEVDAALDEANIGRFTAVLSDFLSSTQFIVITHSKKTMTGADTLYGVTMQESGVSKQVSVRFDDVTDDGFIKPRTAARGENDRPQARAA